ncbi:DNA mismatch repair protein MutS [Massilia sp. Dwa41.01b]|uniref:Smr/MutS family protein n=1 Tax=unclassified Massilia TaxID=2609279 RepID=UPI0015FF1621|nr:MULTISPECIES: Smr/MutS family protein [unclassified Massilia]QNA88621.1 DNA mismatch repair protein MutS [Massilia sp. Dwa41.01b]QNA99511.1 DNA mismatch repair protein MutS [Massilia sp. Se16.2.3]
MKEFADLKALRDRLREEERLRAIEQAEREKQERIARERAVEFQGAMSGVKKMPESNRYVYRPVQEALLREGKQPRVQRTQAEDDALVMQQSLSDLFDVDGLLDDDPTLSYAREGVGPDVVKKLRKRRWPVQDELDLHGMTRDVARGQLGDFVHRSVRRGVRCVRVIHGVGYGSPNGEPVLRSVVHSWLVQMIDVVAFCVAGRADGGQGALIVLLRPALDL